MKKKTKKKIRESMNKIYLLTDFGIGIPYGTPMRHRARKIKDEKRRLLESDERFESACEWFQDIEKAESINTIYTSYYLKHIAERRIGGHLSNGVFIAAAIYCGFRHKSANNHPNVVFNIDKDSVQRKYEESLLYEKYPKERRQDVIESTIF